MTKRQVKVLLEGYGPLSIVKQLQRLGFVKEIYPHGLRKASFLLSEEGFTIVEIYGGIMEKVNNVYRNNS